MQKRLLALLMIGVILMSAAPVRSQDLVAVSDLAGGSSVFVFRNTSKAAPKRVIVKARPARTQVQRIETANRVSKQ